jgi:C4-dicarboxylate-specific signal transduction histidine kinase
MATVGTLCEMLVHEIRTRTLIFGDFLDFANRTYGPFQEQKVLNKFELSKQAVESLDRLANTFAPLANRRGPRRKKLCVLEERIKNCLMILEDEIAGKAVKVSKLRSTTSVAVDAAEIEAVVLNILNNSLFWLSQNSKNNREIQIKLSTIQDGKRTRVFLHDNGPGVSSDFLGQILTPGFSRKPHGIGMGLTVASEIIASVGGELKVASPGTLGGLSVSFDVPNIV